jgi:hypothetical protein
MRYLTWNWLVVWLVLIDLLAIEIIYGLIPTDWFYAGMAIFIFGSLAASRPWSGKGERRFWLSFVIGMTLILSFLAFQKRPLVPFGEHNLYQILPLLAGLLAINAICFLHYVILFKRRRRAEVSRDADPPRING